MANDNTKMAKPRIFISSTCYDLKDARASLDAHLASLGFEVLRSDTLSFGVTPGKHSHEACLDQVDLADYLILLIGSRRGGTYVGSERSITNEEYLRALRRGIPVMIFVRRGVLDAEPLFRKNPGADLSSIVDDVRIFDFVDLVRTQSADNWIKPFDSVQDVSEAVSAQIAYICLLYSQSLVRQRAPSPDQQAPNIVTPFPAALSKVATSHAPEEAAHITRGLAKLHRVLADIQSSSASGKSEKLKALWVVGRHGYFDSGSNSIQVPVSTFKQFAWGTTKGKRVFAELADFRVVGSYCIDDEVVENSVVQVRFNDDEDGDVAEALHKYVAQLLADASGHADIAMPRFFNADMTCYA